MSRLGRRCLCGGRAQANLKDHQASEPKLRPRWRPFLDFPSPTPLHPQQSFACPPPWIAGHPRGCRFWPAKHSSGHHPLVSPLVLASSAGAVGGDGGAPKLRASKACNVRRSKATAEEALSALCCRRIRSQTHLADAGDRMYDSSRPSLAAVRPAVLDLQLCTSERRERLPGGGRSRASSEAFPASPLANAKEAQRFNSARTRGNEGGGPAGGGGAISAGGGPGGVVGREGASGSCASQSSGCTDSWLPLSSSTSSRSELGVAEPRELAKRSGLPWPWAKEDPVVAAGVFALGSLDEAAGAVTTATSAM
mmetsp:Transcript_23179/g.61701  ORF Transcript_23179/g.61701 Transcript_23179/m.61701 type:complete len:309 (+) Transcript_23179:239-1165(+)